ncbi:MAG: dodecin family protein [Acidimicrobiia bacterium]
MTDQTEIGAVKIIEIMGISTESFEHAINEAVAKASESINGITGVEVVKQTGTVKDGRIDRFSVVVKLSFMVK